MIRIVKNFLVSFAYELVYPMYMSRNFFYIALFLLLSGSASSKTLLMDDFSRVDTWQASKGSPAPQRGTEGVVFDVNFGGSADRLSWQRSVDMNMVDVTSIQFDFAVDHSASIRKLSIYFKSGSGWYFWNKDLASSGKQRLILVKSLSAKEGQPAGWNHIEKIKISAWKGNGERAEIQALKLTAHIDSICVLDSANQQKSPERKTMAKRISVRLSHWLKELGVTHNVVKESELTAASLSQTEILLISLSRRLTSSAWREVSAFIDRGGKVIVFFSEDERLAAKMGFNLGPYLKSEGKDSFYSFKFNDPLKWRVPTQLNQRSWHILPVYPNRSDAEVIATWRDGRGVPSGYPAWTASSTGAWMSHIPLEDDSRKKRAMLLGLLGHYTPEIWSKAAAYRMLTYGKAGGYSSYEQIRSRLPSAARERADNMVNSLHQLYQQGRYPQVISLSSAYKAFVGDVLGRAVQGRNNEHRGVWDATGTGWYPGDWDRTCRELKEAGITDIYPKMFTSGIAHYQSRIIQTSKFVKLYGDQLEACVSAAHKYGIKVHVWMMCWSLEGAQESVRQKLIAADRVQKNSRGETLWWLNPAVPENTTDQLKLVREVLQRYKVDGIHMDFIRYYSSRTCYSEASRKRFAEWLGRPPVGWPASALKGELSTPYRQFRCDQINLFVRAVKKEIVKLRPEVKLSAAVFPSYPDSRNSIAQDWGEWIKRGEVDFVVPMYYVSGLQTYAAMLKKHRLALGGVDHIIPGIGVTTSRSQLEPDEVVAQINAIRELGFPGMVFYQLDSTLRDVVFPLLRKGAFRPVE